MKSLSHFAFAALALGALGTVVAGCFSDYHGDCNRDPELDCFWGTGCGDGAVQPGEACDDGNTVDCDGCRGDCSAEETGCGDGFLCGDEQCDDGNTQSGDTCGGDCKVECVIDDLPVSDNPDNYAVFLDPATLHCYARVQKPTKAWSPAHELCIAWGGDLFAFSDPAEVKLVIAGLNGVPSKAWTGGEDSMVDGTFVWSNGEAWPASPPWAAGEPNQPEEGCVAIDSMGQLRDYNCTELTIGAYICEKDMSPPP